MRAGKLVNVEGRRVHLQCLGAGSPTVILDSGLMMPLESWGAIPEAVAAFTRVCSYERPGVGFSDPAPKVRPKTSSDAVAEMAALFQSAGLKGPFLLVGHSFGGLNVRLFAHRNPEKVAGLVLVEPVVERQFEKYAAGMTPLESQKYWKIEQGWNLESMDVVGSGREVEAERELPPVPILVLSSTYNEQQPARTVEHRELQASLVRSLPNARQTIVEGSGHFVQRDRPDAVITAIRECFQLARR